VDFATDGIFMCGLAHSPKFIDESSAQAQAAASRAATILAKDFVTAEGIVCSVNENICSGCGVCELVCPYKAIQVDKEKKVAKVNEALCKGCGSCGAACPSGVISMNHFEDEQILAQIEALMA
jgi:heterodisulfide reductase subunit A